MLIFNCTKAASDFFSVTRKGEKITPVEEAPTKMLIDDFNTVKDNSGNIPDELSQWLVHVIRVQRKPIVFAIEQKTRYVMTFVDLKKGDVEKFIVDFMERMVNTVEFFADDLMILNQDRFEPMIEAFITDNSVFRFFDRSNQSMQTHINDVSYHFKQTAQNTGCLPTTEQVMYFDAGMNEMPKYYKGLRDIIFPSEQMLYHWLRNYGNYSEKELKQASESINELRREFFSTAPFDSDSNAEQSIPEELANNVIPFPSKTLH